MEGASAVKEGELREEVSEIAEPEGEGVREPCCWFRFLKPGDVGDIGGCKCVI